MMPDLEDRVRKVIGDGGPQLPSDEYEERIDRELEHATPVDLLRWMSIAMDDMLEELEGDFRTFVLDRIEQ